MQESHSLLPRNEAALISGCLAKDRASQFRLYQLYAGPMMGVCLRYCKNYEEAEEVLQEGFMRVFTYLHTYKGEGELGAWIRRIMVNCSLMRYQKQAALRPVCELKTVDHDIPVDETITSYLDKKEMLEAVQSLPPSYRLVFNLYVFEGYKHREIADLLQISEGTSKSNLSAARSILQTKIQAQTQFAKYK